MQDAITINYSPAYRYLRLRSLHPSSSEAPLTLPHTTWMQVYGFISQPRVLRTITIIQHSPSTRCHHCTLVSLPYSRSNSPGIPLTRPCTPAPRSSGPFRHQILHSTTPGLPLKPPRLRLSCLYMSLALCFCRIVSITAPSA